MTSSRTLDPQDWDKTRQEAHRMLDDMLYAMREVRARPVWSPIPPHVRERFRGPFPYDGAPLDSIYREFQETILPYPSGNTHPGFMGWVQGGGTAVGMLAEMLAAGMNPNAGGRDHAAIEVEKQIVEWMRLLFEFPEGASGLFVTGTSMANLLAVLVARRAALGGAVRLKGIGAEGDKLRAYASSAVHSCVGRAMDFSGLGSEALRLIPVDDAFRIDLKALRAAIAADRKAGLKPFLVVGSAGTVDTGAIDDLDAIADLCRVEALWFHVDGAYGALGMLSPAIAPRLKGLTRSDSIAFDFHKWGQVPYDSGFLLVRDGKMHYDTFASPAAYLRRETRGLAAGSPWPCDFGPDLSRGFRALKTWFTLKVYGGDAIGETIAKSCELAKYLESRIEAEAALELLSPAQLNIVCFRYRAPDEVNAEIVADIQEAGRVAPSTTVINGKLAIRAALFNHRTQAEDVDALMRAVLKCGAARSR
jgi:glutamate/tyrosine decarboxylase-like PLP-dependent enzyme